MNAITLPLSGQVIDAITIPVVKSAKAAAAKLKKLAAMLMEEAERMLKSATPTKAQVRAVLNKVRDKALPILASVEDWAVGTMNAPVMKKLSRKVKDSPPQAPEGTASASEPTASPTPAPVGWSSLATPPGANGGVLVVWPDPVPVHAEEEPVLANAAQMVAPTTATFLPKVMLRVDADKYDLLAQLAKLSVEQLKDLVALAG